MTRPDPEQPPRDDDAPIRRDDLVKIFYEAEKPASSFRVGGEAEKFGVERATGRPIAYEGELGITRIFDALVRDHGWRAEREVSGGPVIALRRGEASITLEPGAQFELSGTPFDSVHEVAKEMNEHLLEIDSISRELNLTWLGVGFHPTARLEELPWVPKRRYGVMREFLPSRGYRALDMMQRTATVQVNLDYCTEADAMRKLRLLLRVSPILHAMTANAPFVERSRGSRLSERGDVWLHMDPARSGLIPSLWNLADPGYEDYVEWALDAPMFLFRRGEAFVCNTGQSFRDFLASGFEGHRAIRADWVSHVNSLFPEVRLKRTIEARGCDSLPQELASSVPAFAVGLVYDERAMGAAEELMARFDYDDIESARPELVAHGLRATVGGESAQSLAERLLDLAASGLQRRARVVDDRDERIHLELLNALVARGQTPADLLLADLSPEPTVRELLERCAIDRSLAK